MATNTTTDRGKLALDARMVVRFALFLLIYPVVIFLPAGTLNWPMGWAFVAVLLAGTLISRIIALRIHPDLAEERGNYDKKEGVAPWDRGLVQIVATIGPVAQMIVAGLDYRFGWSSVPLWLQWLSLAAVVVAFAISTWAMAANRFFSAVARIQIDRGHHVVDRGPYAVVRHPAYAVGIPVQPAMVLALGSLWGLIPAGITLIMLMVRTALEDRMLRAELPGYEEYAQRVRFRALPGIW